MKSMSKIFSLVKATLFIVCISFATQVRAEFGVEYNPSPVGTYGCVNCQSQSNCSSRSSSCYQKKYKRYVSHHRPVKHYRSTCHKRSSYSIKVYRVEQVNPCACASWQSGHCDSCGRWVPGRWVTRNGSYVVVEERSFSPDMRTADDTGAELSLQ